MTTPNHSPWPANQTLRIAILDDYTSTATPYFTRLQQSHPHIPMTLTHFPTTLHPLTSPHDHTALLERLAPFHILSTMRERTPFPPSILSNLPNLKLLLNSSARNKSIDLETATERGVVVTGTGNSAPESEQEVNELKVHSGGEMPPEKGYSYVVQHAWGLLLGLCSRVGAAEYGKEGGIRNGGWGGEQGFCTSLGGKVLGIVGLGKLGGEMARIAVLGFGMRVVAWSENLGQGKADEVMGGLGIGEGIVKVVGKRELFEGSDVVSLHYVLSERSRGVVGRREMMEWMKKSAFLVNTSRGGLVDEGVLIEALKEGRIKGVALDVFWEEPLSEDSVWRRAEEWVSERSQLIMSPHFGYRFEGLLNRMYQEQVGIVEKWIQGEEVPNRMN